MPNVPQPPMREPSVDDFIGQPCSQQVPVGAKVCVGDRRIKCSKLNGAWRLDDCDSDEVCRQESGHSAHCVKTGRWPF
jgi:hypothetical protein